MIRPCSQPPCPGCGRKAIAIEVEARLCVFCIRAGKTLSPPHLALVPPLSDSEANNTSTEGGDRT
jgi:hypothetical protein